MIKRPKTSKRRRDSLHVLRRLARDISQHRHDPIELGFDLEEMADKAVGHPDLFIRTLAVRYLTRRQFGPSRDPRRRTAA